MFTCFCKTCFYGYKEILADSMQLVKIYFKESKITSKTNPTAITEQKEIITLNRCLLEDIDIF